MNTATETRIKTLKKSRALTAFCSTFLLTIVLFACRDFISDIRTDETAYEIRYEEDETFSQAGKICRLYVGDAYRGDVDYNVYGRTDENGNTDYRYCTLIEDASSLTYTAILCAMFFVVLIIYNNSQETTPFTKQNINLVKLISLLQIFLAVLPGAVRMIMSFVRFNYYHSVIGIESLYMLAIAVVIGAIAFIFEKGLALQEDVDSIA